MCGPKDTRLDVVVSPLLEMAGSEEAVKLSSADCCRKGVPDAIGELVNPPY